MKEKIIMAAEDTETIINYSKYHLGEWAEAYTTDKTVMRRYERFADKHPEYCKLLKEDKYSMTFSVDPKCAGLFPKAPRKLQYTDEQKKVLVDRLAAARNKAV